MQRISSSFTPLLWQKKKYLTKKKSEYESFRPIRQHTQNVYSWKRKHSECKCKWKYNVCKEMSIIRAQKKVNNIHSSCCLFTEDLVDSFFKRNSLNDNQPIVEMNCCVFILFISMINDQFLQLIHSCAIRKQTHSVTELKKDALRTHQRNHLHQRICWYGKSKQSTEKRTVWAK